MSFIFALTLVYLIPQCFDLESFLSTNTFVSGNRWRCASCESFVSLRNLERCGLTSHVLREFASTVSIERDRVEVSDRSYKLLKIRGQRGMKRLRSEDAALEILL